LGHLRFAVLFYIVYTIYTFRFGCELRYR